MTPRFITGIAASFVLIASAAVAAYGQTKTTPPGGTAPGTMTAPTIAPMATMAPLSTMAPLGTAHPLITPSPCGKATPTGDTTAAAGGTTATSTMRPGEPGASANVNVGGTGCESPMPGATPRPTMTP